MTHIAVERNRRRQMNEHLKVLRSLTPCFYIKRGDQASIISGVIDFIKELHQVAQSLETRKRRKTLMTPIPNLISPPQQEIPSWINSHNLNGLQGVCCNSPIANVEAKISGSNIALKTLSRRIPGQISRIIALLENLSFHILQLNISTMDDTVLNSFLIKVGLKCEVSLEDLANEVQKCFCCEPAAAISHRGIITC